jgi:filamentous hemagglutinin family protein
MNMLKGFIDKMLRGILCLLVLLPDFVLAAQPGVYSGRPATPNINLPNKTGPGVTIPGFSGGMRTFNGPPAHALPELIDIERGADTPGIQGNKMTINQTEEKAVINWKTFDIGADSEVQFDQKGNADWAALNRIWDKDPSYIFGKLTADGKIYLINQNGILFGPGSKINVGSLTASALNIDDNDFINNILKFKHINYRSIDDPEAEFDPYALVSNHGEINAKDGGHVFLIGPFVDNSPDPQDLHADPGEDRSGLINAPSGQIGLIAGTDVELVKPGEKDNRREGLYYVLINNSHDDIESGNAVNQAYLIQVDGKQKVFSGKLNADGGIVGMYGTTVDHWGIIRSTTAFKNNKGEVELRAAHKVRTGADSRISLPVDNSLDPETGKIRTISDTFDIQSTVFIGGLKNGSPVNSIEHGGEITAHSGTVTLDAADRVYLETNSLIDVSGTVAELAPSLITDFSLTSMELRDAYPQKNGILPGRKINTTVQSGSAIGDLSGALMGQDRTALERSSGGFMRKTLYDGEWDYAPQTGTITINAANGDIIIKENAVLDFSGGEITYLDGFVDSTKLLSGNKIYDIRNAPLNVQYSKILGMYAKRHERFGVADQYSGLYYGGASPLKPYVNGFTKGGDAGILNLTAATIIMDGRLRGGVTRGAFQNTWTMKGSYTADLSEDAEWAYDVARALSMARGLEAPRAGTLTVSSYQDANPSMYTSSISVVSGTSPRSDLTADAGPLQGPTLLDVNILNDARLGALSLSAGLEITTAPGAGLNLQPGGTFLASARRIIHEGEIKAPAGSIRMTIDQKKTSHGGVEGIYGDFNPNPYSKELPGGERIVLGSGSLLDVSGERIDNSLVGKKEDAVLRYGQTTAGRIDILDKTDEGQGVFIEGGAVVDVSGGYSIDSKGKVTGGNAGMVSLQGSNLMLEGDLRGHALSDLNGKILGGAVTLASKEIYVAEHGADWSGFDTRSGIVQDPMKGLQVAGNRFDDTGFTQITLNSYGDVDISSTIATSLVKLKNPASVKQTGGASAVQVETDFGSPAGQGLIRLDGPGAFMTGPSSFTARAGVEFEGTNDIFQGNLKKIVEPVAKITISDAAEIRTAPAVSSVTRIAQDVGVNPAAVKTGITLEAPTTIEVGGKLESRGGNITVKAKKDLIIKKGAGILAGGYNRPDPASSLKNLPMNFLPVRGGSVTLEGADNLVLEEGSSIDISGFDAVENRMQSADGDAVVYREAGAPGSLSLTYSTLTGVVAGSTVKAGHADLAGIQDAALTISKNNELEVASADIARYKDAGFDDITLKSISRIEFNESMNVKVDRKLTLDSPEIGIDSARTKDLEHSVTLQSPWIVLTNTFEQWKESAITVPAADGTSITLSSAGWMDLNGGIKISGFKDVNLEAARDIRLADRLYTNPVDLIQTWGNKLLTAGNLTMKADRIYPVALNLTRKGNNPKRVYPVDYTIHSGGKVTILPANIRTHDPIYSAGGNLAIEAAKGIEHRGTLAAPLGTITLTDLPDPEGTAERVDRIYLAEGSVLTTAGAAGVEYNYGNINDNNKWIFYGKTELTGKTPGIEDELAANKKNVIKLSADETIVGSGADIDVSGGGALFAFQWRPGIEGTVDPLAKPSRYLIFENNSFQMPGPAVYLKAGGGVSEGLYTILNLSENPQYAQYAFMPGAHILELQSGTALPGPQSLSKYGYPLAVGYDAVNSTGILSTRPKVYSVRTAADVLTEGHFDKQTLISGHAGDITITGKTTVIGGNFNAAPLNSNYRGGKVTLSGTNVRVRQSAGAPLPPTFRFDTAMDEVDQGRDPEDKLKDKLTLSADSLSDKGFREVSLGDEGTDNLTIENGLTLEASIITLSAGESLTVRENAKLHAITDNPEDEGVLSLITAGRLSVESGALLHASHDIILDVNNVDDIQGDLQVDNSSITLKSAAILFGALPAEEDKSTGLYVTEEVWNRFSGYKNITFASASDIRFMEDRSLSAAGSLTFDAAGILDMKQDGASLVTLEAPVVNLKNSGGTSTTELPDGKVGMGVFTVKEADQINIGSGDVYFGGFEKIAFNSKGDVAFTGKGTLSTGSADLDITASRITNSAGSTAEGLYQAPDFRVIAGTGKNDLNPAGLIKMMGPGGQQAGPSGAGGVLEVAARKIEVGTVIQVDGGDIKLTTAVAFLDQDGIILNQGGAILATGTDDAPGGRVTLATNFIDGTGQEQSGRIDLQEGSLLDVSAGTQGDAGLVTLLAPKGGVLTEGVLKGTAGVKKDGSIGRGGSLVLDAHTVDLPNLNDTLKAGGFTESIDLRARTGNMVVTPDMTYTYETDENDPTILRLIVDRAVKAHMVRLTADSGEINVYGTIDASAYSSDSRGHEDTYYKDGGNVELYAHGDLTVFSEGVIKAAGTNGGIGGEVSLRSSGGAVIVSARELDVSGSTGGIIYMRARQNESDVNISLNRSVKGASALYVEAVRRYNYDVFNFTSALDDAHAHYANAPIERLSNKVDANTTAFHYLPGIEVVSAGDINWNTQWDMSGVRFGSEQAPGVLTLRASGNLYINSNLVDHPTDRNSLTTSSVRDSWGFNLIAGADTAGANYMAVIKGRTGSAGNPVGNLRIADQKVVYSESAPVSFASGNDTIIGKQQGGNLGPGYMINSTIKYNLASYDGAIRGNVGRDLIIDGGAVQTATGDISVSAGRDLQLNGGSIRTTGQAPAGTPAGSDPTPTLRNDPDYLKKTDAETSREEYWRYFNGGDISIDAGGNIGKYNSGNVTWTPPSKLDSLIWDKFTLINEGSKFNKKLLGVFSADYDKAATQGLATMGGGDIYVRAGRDFMSQAGTFGAGAWDPELNQYTFGSGDIAIYAGGDMQGRFLSMNGNGDLHAMGNFGADTDTGRVQIELFNSRMNVTALGEIQIGAMLNPSLASNKNDRSLYVSCAYTGDTSISLKAGTDVTIAGKSPFYSNDLNEEITETVLPARVDIEAVRGNIVLNKDFTLAPSADGNLRLAAGVDLTTTAVDRSYAQIMMSDMDPDEWYGRFSSNNSFNRFATSADIVTRSNWISDRIVKGSVVPNNHGYYGDAGPLHRDDPEPILINAGRDIKDIKFYLPKKAYVTAGRDIIDMAYEGQNINKEDVTSVFAGRDIVLGDNVIIDLYTGLPTERTGLIQGGPGVFMVQAGNSIDLGISNNYEYTSGGVAYSVYGGIQAIGRLNNYLLGKERGALIVISGYDKDMTDGMVRTFFDEIRHAGDQYADLMSRKKTGEAAELLEATRHGIIERILGKTPTGDGDINMISSQIAVPFGQSDLFIISGGDLNVGKTALSTSKAANTKTGIMTAAGGGVNIYSVGDVNVHESRIMTFFSRKDMDDMQENDPPLGHITIWSWGDINAGRGARTAVSADPPKKIKLPDGGYLEVFTPPAVGSGIRAVTYGENPPEPGDIHLTAPSGVIDAGEAGISGGKIILAALEVKNSANISFSAGSVGVPQASTSGAALGGLTGGAGTVAQPGQMAGDATPGIAAERTAQAAQMIDDILMKWLDVKVIDLVQEEEEE